MRKHRKSKDRAQGFTLIELLVVVLIIGVLASVAIPQYFKVVEKSRVSEAYSTISAIKSAEERYLAKQGVYTTNLQELDISYAGMTAGGVGLKFYNAGVPAQTGDPPKYVVNVTRHTNAAKVSPRYGLYTVTVNVPDAPVPSCSVTNCQSDLMD